jgi:hypothetical protein
VTVHRPISPPAAFGRRWGHPRIPNGRDVRTATSPDLTTFPGFTLSDCDLQYGDELERIVSWQGQRDLGKLRGRPVRMVIELKDADLFALRFEQENDE